MDNTQPSIILPTKDERLKLFGSVPPIKGSKPTAKDEMPDLQNKPNNFLFPLDAVGICKVTHPITVHSTMKPEMQHTVGTFDLTTSLIRDSKGINMSRLTEQLEQYHQEGWLADVPHFCKFAKELSERMNQKSAEIEVRFPWFFERPGPVLEKKGLMHAQAGMKVTYTKDQGFLAEVSLQATVTTLCPCSKEISEYSAHNQRGIITIKAGLADPLNMGNIDWKERLLYAAESNASALIHPVLKRPDEKKVTETAYENPRFVEDMVRLIAADLYEMDFIQSFSVECRNEESIHLHDAIARVTFHK